MAKSSASIGAKWEKKIEDLQEMLETLQDSLDAAYSAVDKIRDPNKIKKVGFKDIRLPLQTMRNKGKEIRDYVTELKEYATKNIFG